MQKYINYFILISAILWVFLSLAEGDWDLGITNLLLALFVYEHIKHEIVI